jgi:hypothetical protein
MLAERGESPSATGIRFTVGVGWEAVRCDPSEPEIRPSRYLQAAREALLWKLDGLSEYDIRRPLTPTGTNLLG